MAVVEALIRTDLARPRQLDVPPAARHAVVRTGLIHRVCTAPPSSVAVIVAPAGYGKTTLLAQCAQRDGRDVLGVAFEPEDDDASGVELLLGEMAEEPNLLVLLDDIHVLQSRAALGTLERLLDRLAGGTTVVLSGRRLPQLPLARLRAEGRLLQIGVDELALSKRETETLLRRAGAPLARPEATALAERLEGWPAALFLAALSIRNGTPPETVDGNDGYLADYLETEHLSVLTGAQRRFARSAAVLDELTPEACDALLGRRDAKALLEALESAGVVAAIDHHHRRYRYPRIVRDVLLGELEQAEPEQARELHRAAAVRAAELGSTEEALEHAVAAADVDRVAELAAALAVSSCGRGQLDVLEPSLLLLHDEPVVESYPDLCLAASWLHAVRGRAPDAQHWGDATLRGLPGADARLHVLQALRCRDGADQMLDDTTAACGALPPGASWRPAAMLAHGVALLLAGDAARAERALVEAVELAAAADASELRVVGLCCLALLVIAGDAHLDADAFAAEAAAAAAADPPARSVVALLVEAVAARSAARRDDNAEATAALERAEHLLDYATPAVPWLAALALLELAHVRVTLADAEGARALLRRVADIFRVRPRLGLLVERSAELDQRTHTLAGPAGRWACSLTPAESRLLPLLATHLSFREIGERLYVSRNTVKTQAIAVYRKFGVTSRSAAISRAIELGFIDESAPSTRRSFPCPD
ncbi:MAG TPA: LuxR C-terminal-related transcriptional regulator [Gaiellaceae bacterium]